MANAPAPKHMDPKYAAEMKKRRIITISIVAIVLVVVIALVVKGLLGGNKPEEPTTAAPTAPSTTVEIPTEEPSTEAPTEATSTTTTTKPTTSTTGTSKSTTSTTKSNGVSKDTASVASDGTVTFKVTNKYIDSHKYCVAVNTRMNRVTVYTKDDEGNYTKPIKSFVCSCGRESCSCTVPRYKDRGIPHSHRTPPGVFKTDGKPRHTWLKMVDSSYGQYTTNINGAIWFHSVCYTGQDKSKLETEEYNKLGSQASLGCVRLCVRDAKWIYKNLDKQTLVFVYSSSVAGPIGVTDSVSKIDLNSKNKGWDPTDPDANNPW